MKQLLSLAIIISALVFCVTDVKAESAARVIYMKGEVNIQAGGSVNWIPAKKGSALKDNDKIKTAGGSAAEIALDGTLKNIVKLEPDTEVTLKNLKAKSLVMPKGKILSVMESLPKGSSFEVRTPTAVAGVAGSGMSVGTDGAGTEVGCFQDKAYTRGINPDGTLMDMADVDEGYKRLIELFGAPGDPLALTELEKEQWGQFREELGAIIEGLKTEGSTSSDEGADNMQEQVGNMHEGADDKLSEAKENAFELKERDKRDEATKPAEEKKEEGGGPAY